MKQIGMEMKKILTTTEMHVLAQFLKEKVKNIINII